jgi:hypothetical protein
MVRSMEEITIYSFPSTERAPRERLSTPSIVLAVEAESSKGRLILKVSATALGELLGHLKSLKLLSDSL